MTDPPPELRPARPDVDVEERGAYRPRIPWKVILPTLIVLLAGVAIYQWNEHRHADSLRAQIIAAHGRLGPVSERYLAFRRKIERWAIDAAKGTPQRRVDPRLRLSALHKGQGLYLRLRAQDARTREGIARGARAMEADGITRCLGVSPASVRGLYEHGDFLDPAWLRRARDTSDVLTLRVIDDELVRRTNRDLPPIANTLHSDWFLLVLERGRTRRRGPVDVYLWELRGGRPLLSVRTEPHGMLVPVHIALKGTPRTPRPPTQVNAVGADDCSIAAQIKELTGETPMTFESVPTPTSTPSDAGVPDAGARDSGAAPRR